MFKPDRKYPMNKENRDHLYTIAGMLMDNHYHSLYKRIGWEKSSNGNFHCWNSGAHRPVYIVSCQADGKQLCMISAAVLDNNQKIRRGLMNPSFCYRKRRKCVFLAKNSTSRSFYRKNSPGIQCFWTKIKASYPEFQYKARIFLCEGGVFYAS